MTIEGRFLSGNFRICSVPKKEYCDRCTDSNFWQEAKANTNPLNGYMVNLCPECEAKFGPFSASFRAEFDAKMKAQWPTPANDAFDAVKAVALAAFILAVAFFSIMMLVNYVL